MSETLRMPQTSQTYEPSQKYFNFQIKGWTNFDPMHKTLARIAEEIEEGGGFLTLVEVVRVENNLASIGDQEVTECFQNILAAKRLIQNVHGLPKKLVEALRSALNAEEEVAPDGLPKQLVEELFSELNAEEESAPKKNVAPVTSSSMNDKPTPRTRFWP
jgi:hypothetical protein